MAYKNLSHLTIEYDTEANVETFPNSLEEIAIGISTDTNSLGIYVNGAWVWIGGTGGITADDLHQHTYQEDHSDECDGVETNFITANQFEADTTMVWLNGVLQQPGVDYSEDATLDAVTFTTAPEAGDILIIAYIVDLEI